MLARAMKPKKPKKSTLAAIGFLSSYQHPLSAAARLAGMTLLWVSGIRNDTIDRATRVVNNGAAGSFVLAARPFPQLRGLQPCQRTVPPRDTFEAFWRKDATKEWMRAHNMGQFAIVDIPHDALNSSELPVVMKPTNGMSGMGVAIIKTGAYMEKIKALHKRGVMYERAISNDTEWGVHFAAHNGSLLFLKCMKIVFRAPLFVRAKRLTTKMKSLKWLTCPNELADMTSDIVRASSYGGIGCTGVKYESGDPKLIEVNPRVCGMALNTPNTQKQLLDAVSAHVARCLHGSRQNAARVRR